MPHTEFLIQPFGPLGGGQLLNYDIIEFPEEGNMKSSNQIKFPSLKSGRGQMVSTPEQETLQLRALKLQTPIKGTFPLSSFTLRREEGTCSESAMPGSAGRLEDCTHAHIQTRHSMLNYSWDDKKRHFVRNMSCRSLDMRRRGWSECLAYT